MLDRIAAVDPTINAFCLVAGDEALASARGERGALAARRARRSARRRADVDQGPHPDPRLADPAGQPDRRPRPAVGRRRAGDGPPARGGCRADRQDDDAGVRVQGRDELRARPGITRNPWDPTRTPGGSSGGTAAAVAAGLGPLSVGTDGAGSVRIPAAFCGNVGLKPSFGRVPAYPLSPFGTVSHLGPHTMSVADAALMLERAEAARRPRLDVAAARRPRLPRRARRRHRRAAHRLLADARATPTSVDPEVAAAVAAAAEDLAAAGAIVEAVDPGFDDPLEITTGPLVHRRLDAVEHADARAAGGHRSRLRRRGRARVAAEQPRRATAAPAARRARVAHAAVHGALRPPRHAVGGGAGVRGPAGRAHRR